MPIYHRGKLGLSVLCPIGSIMISENIRPIDLILCFPAHICWGVVTETGVESTSVKIEMFSFCQDVVHKDA